MNTKLIQIAARLSLLCYLAVSSVAAVHAFPAFEPRSSEQTEVSVLPATSSVVSNAATMPHCDQVPTIETGVSDQAKSSVSVCKVFCAAMSNVIANDLTIDSQSTQANSAIAFLAVEFHSLAPQLEIQPPRRLPIR